jgi:hypothetical protein
MEINSWLLVHSEAKGISFDEIVKEELSNLSPQVSYSWSAAQSRKVFAGVFCGVLLLATVVSVFLGFFMLIPRF